MRLFDGDEDNEIRLFCGERYTYREGGAKIKEIENTEGIEGLWDAFYMDPDEFAERYGCVLDRYR